MKRECLKKFASDLARVGGLSVTYRDGPGLDDFGGEPAFSIINIGGIDYYFYTDAWRRVRGRDKSYDGWCGSPSAVCDNSGKSLAEVLTGHLRDTKMEAEQ